MNGRGITLERVQSFSDGVFAVIITILVLDLHVPEQSSWDSIALQWPMAASYAVSYLFVAIAWLNGHHLLQHAERVTPRLIWSNFAHLFSVSLVPFATAWMSKTRLAEVPVCVYAAVFVLVNISYMALCMEAVDTAREEVISQQLKSMMRVKATVTLCIFAGAGVLALWYPVIGFCVVTLTLMSYLRPGART
jgi:uncharacterized membrane protein